MRLTGNCTVFTVLERIYEDTGVIVQPLTQSGREASEDARFIELRAQGFRPKSSDFARDFGRMQVRNFEEAFLEHYGARVQVLEPGFTHPDPTSTMASVRRRWEREQDGLPPLAQWLSSAMTDSGMTVDELSLRAQVARLTIQNILSGKTQNPLEQTIQALESALGKAIPTQTTEDIQDNARIDSIAAMVDFNPYEDSEIPTGSGIYVLYDVSERPVYIGKSTSNVRNRIRAHREKFWFREPIVTNGAYVAIDNDLLIDQIEKLLIRFLKSNAVINKQHADR